MTSIVFPIISPYYFSFVFCLLLLFFILPYIKNYIQFKYTIYKIRKVKFQPLDTSMFDEVKKQLELVKQKQNTILAEWKTAARNIDEVAVWSEKGREKLQKELNQRIINEFSPKLEELEHEQCVLVFGPNYKKIQEDFLNTEEGKKVSEQAKQSAQKNFERLFLQN